MRLPIGTGVLGALVALSAAIVVFTAASIAQQTATISPAPAFKPNEMTASPTTYWVTNGGNLWNQRYSPLQKINRGNVANLKAEWRASLKGSGVTPRSSNQAEPVYHDGVLYITASLNDVFAVDVDTGKQLWEYYAKLDPEGVNACCGWAVHGLVRG